MQFHLVVAPDKRGDHRQRVQVQGAVRQHDALGRTGGTAGVKQLADGGFVNSQKIRTVDAPARQQVFVRLADRNPIRDGLGRRAQLLDERFEIRLVDDDARLGVVQNTGQFQRREPHVERHHDGPGQQDSEIALQQFVVVKTEIRHAVARADAQAVETSRQPLATLAEFGIRETAAAGNHPGFPGIQIYPAIQATDGAERHVHCPQSIYQRAD